jgi:hypothetical protein
MASLDRRVAELPAIQARFVERHAGLRRNDRIAHQQQIAGGLVRLTVAPALPEQIRDIGLFKPNQVHCGVGRISNGLGCPHIETDPDFLGIMLAFRTGDRRVDFLGINHPTSPTDTIDEFVALLAATAEAAGVTIPAGDIGRLDLGNVAAAQVKLFNVLRKRLGLVRAARIFAHVAKQTSRTLLSSSAYQSYWTGILKLAGTPGKFTLVPHEDVNRRRPISPGTRHLTVDWRQRSAQGDLGFRLVWIPYLSELETPIERLTKNWAEAHRVEVGSVIFARTDADTREAKLFAVLASEMGANPGNWIGDRHRNVENIDGPATEFEAGRSLAYRKSQSGRSALPESLYASVFESGEIAADLATELVRRYRANRETEHGGPDLGVIT